MPLIISRSGILTLRPVFAKGQREPGKLNIIESAYCLFKRSVHVCLRFEIRLKHELLILIADKLIKVQTNIILQLLEAKDQKT